MCRNHHMHTENKRQSTFSSHSHSLGNCFPTVFYMETVKLTQRSLNTFYDEIHFMCMLLCICSYTHKLSLQPNPSHLR